MRFYPAEIEQMMQQFYETLSEKDRRRYAAIEAKKLGRKFPQKVVPLEAVFIVILFWKCAKSPHPQEGGIVAVVVGLWIVWAGTFFVAVHPIHSLACQCSPFPF